MKPADQPTCPLCAGYGRYMLQVCDVNRGTVAEEFSYYGCIVCDSVFMWPVPSDLGRFYPSDYYALPADLGRLRYYASMRRHQLDLVRRFAPAGRLLEVGPAFGAFAFMAKASGYEVTAIEMDARCCEYLEVQVGVSVVHTTQVAASLANAQPQHVIVMWQVIEHLPDLRACLDAAALQLEPGGILALSWPNPRSVQFRLLKRRWTHLDAPRHTQLVSAEGLRTHLGHLRLRSVYESSADADARHWNRFGWQESIGNYAGSRSAKLALRALGRMTSVALAPIEALPGLGSSYTMVLRKE